MKTKLLEIRDSATCIVAMATKTEAENTNEAKFLERCGWDNSTIILTKMNGEAESNYDAFVWREDGTRTMFEAHRYINEHFDELNSFDIIDVQYILGETSEKKTSDILFTEI